MTKIKLQLNYPAKINVIEDKIIHPTLEELKPEWFIIINPIN